MWVGVFFSEHSVFTSAALFGKESYLTELDPTHGSTQPMAMSTRDGYVTYACLISYLVLQAAAW